MQGNIWADDGEERALAAEEFVAFVEAGVDEDVAVLGFHAFDDADWHAEVAHLAAARNQAAAIVESDAEGGRGGAGGLLVGEKAEGFSSLRGLAWRAEDFEGDAAAQEGFDALDVHLEHTGTGFDGGGRHAPEAGV